MKCVCVTFELAAFSAQETRYENQGRLDLLAQGSGCPPKWPSKVQRVLSSGFER
jgi:hypothetical protein